MSIAPARSDTRHLGALEHFNLSFFWFATNVHWGAIIAVLVQSQVVVMVGKSLKGTAAGLAIGLGSVTAIVLPPLLGAWSDRVRTRLGRRRPFMLAGTALNIMALAGLASFPFLPTAPLWGFTGAYWLYVGAYLAANLANNLATAPYTALLPDVVPKDQLGAASGWYGLMSTVGNAVGIMLAGSLVNHEAPRTVFQNQITIVYTILAAVLLAGVLVTVLGTPEPPPVQAMAPPRRDSLLRSLFSPFRSPDFFWVFFTRLLVTMGIFSVQNFLLFYMDDVVREFTLFGRRMAATAEGAVSQMFLVLLAVAVPSAIVGGKLSDRIGRKRLVYFSGGTMAMVAVGLIVFHSFAASLLIGALFGLGYGTYTSVDWALACDVLPDRANVAKDMGVWHMALTLPQLIATPLAGRLLDVFQTAGRARGLPDLGYTVVFSVAVCYFVLGTLLVRRVRKSR